MKKECSI